MKHFLKNSALTKRIPLFAVMAGLLFFGSTAFAHADFFDIGDIAYTVVGKFAFAISYLIALMGGVVIAIEAWLIGVVLSMNMDVLGSPIVQNGFAVTLSLANLGFVFAIIVIAIATILRRETYGIKKLLWKLVVAAILVNFSLVIMAPIFGFGNSLAQYFLNCIDPSVGCGNASATTFTSMNYFAERLAGAFNPQKSFLSINQINAGNPQFDSLSGAFSVTGSSFGKMLVPIFSLLFVGAALVVICVTLFVFIAMLLMRYVWIAILAVLMPFAWLMWIFPNLSKHWSKWWSDFIRWTFFAPIVLFFLWLGLTTVASMSTSTTGSQNFAMYTSPQNTIWTPISGLFTNAFSPVIQNLLNQIVLIALMIGGLRVANHLSITGAAAGMTALKSAGNAVKGYAGRQSKKGARWTYQRAGGEKINQRLMGSRIPFASTVGRGLSSVTEKGGKDLVKQASSSMKVGDMSDDNLILAAKGARGHDHTLAVIEEAQKRGKLNKLKEVGGEKDLNAYLAKNEQVFKDYGKQKLDSDINTALMSNRTMRELAQIKAAEMAKAREQVEIPDKNGIVATNIGGMVNAARLADASRKIVDDTQKIVSAKGAGEWINHQGRQVRAGDLLKNAREASREAENAIDARWNVDVADTEGLLGVSGQMVKVGDLLRAASEKFMAGMDKSDPGKMLVGEIFGPMPKFGLSKEALDALGGAITHAAAIQKPTLIAPMAAKLDSAATLQNFFNKYQAGIEQARNSGRVSDEDYELLSKNFVKGLKRGFFFGYGASGSTQETSGAQPAAPSPAPAAPPPPPTH